MRSLVSRLSRRAALIGVSASLAVAALPVAAQTPVKLQVGYIPVLGVSQLFVMEGEGWAKAAGLDLQITRFDSGPAMIQALASGKLDILYAGVSPFIVAKANGIGVTVLAATATEEIALVGRGTFADLVAKTGSAARFSQANPARCWQCATTPVKPIRRRLISWWPCTSARRNCWRRTRRRPPRRSTNSSVRA